MSDNAEENKFQAPLLDAIAMIEENNGFDGAKEKSADSMETGVETVTPADQEQPKVVEGVPRVETVTWLDPVEYGSEDDGKNSNITCYTGFENGKLRVRLGDYVFLKPADPSTPNYIAKIEKLMEIPPLESGKKPRRMASMAWYYRPEELEIDSSLPIYRNEIFAADEKAMHPIETISGLCKVVKPQQLTTTPGEDVFVCSRKYVPQEGRVVPLEGMEEHVGKDDRDYLLSNHKVESRSPLAPSSKSIKDGESEKKPKRTMARRKRKEREQYSPEPSNVVKTKGGRVVHPPRNSAAWSSLDGAYEEEIAVQGSKTPKSKYGRWTAERYNSAQSSLVAILRQLGAGSPHKAILRPLLREEARKVIGDTGLLDHLLRHLTDQVVSEHGEKLRRRHNREGHMEYWLQDPGAAVVEEEMINEEMQALSAELREIREARNMLQTVRSEAADAINAVKGLKEIFKHEVSGLDGKPMGKDRASEGILQETSDKTVEQLTATVLSLESEIIALKQGLNLQYMEIMALRQAMTESRNQTQGQ